MKTFTLIVPALLALAACDGGTQSAETDAEEARAEGNIVGSGAVSQPNAPPAEIDGIPTALHGCSCTQVSVVLAAARPVRSAAAARSRSSWVRSPTALATCFKKASSIPTSASDKT